VGTCERVDIASVKHADLVEIARKWNFSMRNSKRCFVSGTEMTSFNGKSARMVRLVRCKYCTPLRPEVNVAWFFSASNW